MLRSGDRPIIVTGAELSDWLGIARRTLTEHAAAGHVVKSGRGFDLKASVQAFTAHQRGVASGRGGAEQVLNLTEERARMAQAQADAQEMKNAVLRGELAPVADMKRAMSDSYRKVRSRILAVPNRVRQLLGHIGQMEASVMDRELRDALSELGHADEDGEGDGQDDDEQDR